MITLLIGNISGISTRLGTHRPIPYERGSRYLSRVFIKPHQCPLLPSAPVAVPPSAEGLAAAVHVVRSRRWEPTHSCVKARIATVPTEGVKFTLLQ